MAERRKPPRPLPTIVQKFLQWRAKNGLSRSEIAGVCFSPDGRAMFVNLQTDGITLAITGPFEDAART